MAGVDSNGIAMQTGYSSEKSDRGCDSKLTQEEMYRQILVGDFDLSSSPEYRCFSPSFEEKCVGHL